ncbi:MAG TPA: amino acid adenylation domain-containing protein, partial [Candidatus Angelobacter sp.]|nr:amino acid adenylation domain-containing protein [Candidatus Angelobacter sp.]
VLRTDVSGDPGFTELIGRVRKNALEAYGNQEVPFERVVEAVQPERTQSRHPLFQVVLTLQNAPQATLDLPEIVATEEPFSSKAAKFDLGFGLRERLSSSGDALGIEGEVEYSRDLFDDATVRSLVSRFVQLLCQAIKAPATRMHHFEILSSAEKRLLLESFNDSSRPIPDSTVTEIFEDQVSRTPDLAAIVQGDSSISYRSLNEQANALAHYLQSKGIGPESLVGIAFDRSVAMMVAILAVWKAGAAYLPLDPEYPAARLQHMLSDAQPQVVLTAMNLPRLPSGSGIEFIALDAEETMAALKLLPSDNPKRLALPQNAAYVIYTSGSTGIPKGVMVSHVGIPSLARSHVEKLQLTQRSRVLQFASLNFDASFWEMLMALTTGAALILPDDERGGLPLQDLLRDQRVSHATLTPSVLSTLDHQRDSGPETLIVVGEKCPAELVARWSRGRTMINAYGPTEITVCATISKPLSGHVSPPIGLPNINTRVYVLNADLQLVPVGVIGELYISGKGVARGYLNRPALTAGRFVANPFANEPGERMYRTGDLARWRADGNLEFIGRTDEQVKLRGFRIELGEIESALRSLPEIADTAVVVNNDERRGKQIVAYVVGNTQQALDPAEVRWKLGSQLPAHMVPAAIAVLERMPLTASGKIDRATLAKRGIEEERINWLTSPRTEMEQSIAKVWKDVLGRDDIGVQENFFDRGGHSLLLVQVHSKLQKLLTSPLPMVKLFEHPTIASLAAYLEGQTNSRGQKLKDARKLATKAIAIIGMACRFPGAPSIKHFWENLTRGIDSVTAASEEELSSLPPDVIQSPGFVNATGRLKNIELFDAAFFGLSPAEATATDPQQRLLLECAWEALESAGHNPRGQRIGVFAGAGESHYRDLLRGDTALARSLGELQLLIGTGKDHIAPRLSYLLDLRGPSVPVNTACSTSLVAVHLACQSLMSGECEMALAGGVSIAPQTGYTFEENGILSPDGRCRAFDVNARGTVPGSGAALVLLKPLEQAIADGDHIHAVIKGSAINNDGNLKVGYTAPGVEGQRRVIEQALSNAAVNPSQLSYVETHGTGTPLGDPIEIEALRQVFTGNGAGSSIQKTCAIGSVKTNIGHCDSAAGIAGLIKAVLCLEHCTLVPNLHFEKPNPQLDLEHGPFYVSTQTGPWEPGPRLAGVSSFGIGGTNAHVVLAEAPCNQVSGRSRSWQVLTLSARTESALENKKADLVNALLECPDRSLADVAFTLNSGRQSFPVRQSFICGNTADAIAAINGKKEKPSRAGAQDRSVVFLFPGQGKAYVDLGADLYRDETSFREEVDRCCNTLIPLIGADLRDFMFASERGVDSRIYRPLFWQPALFVVEYAMAQLWMSWGIQPAAMIGHSLGEYVAATVAGVLELDDALMLVAERARGTEDLKPGAMLAIPASENEIRPYIKDGISLAAVNAPELCVLAGPTDEIERLSQQIAFLNPIRLEASHAFHSGLVEPLMERLTRAAGGLRLGRPEIPYLSNVTGRWIDERDATNPGYWARHLRGTVRFNDCLQEALKKPNCILLEVGPGKVLSELARRAYPEIASFASTADGPSGRALAEAVGRLWSEGVEIDWLKYYADEKRQRVPLPTYPFERQRYWVDTKVVGSEGESDPLAFKASLENWFFTTNWKRTNPLRKAIEKGTQHWLVFSEPEGIGAEIAEMLRKSGQSMVEVRRGESLQNGNGPQLICPSNPEHYQRLFQSIENDLALRIVYAWDLGNESGIDAVSGFNNLIYLAQALGSLAKVGPARLAVITHGLHRVLDEEMLPYRDSAMLGLAHVLPKEMPAVHSQNIDLDAGEAGTMRRQVNSVLAELASESSDPLVAYRGGHRWLPIVEQVTPAVNGTDHFKRGGVYVMTHALQEIGFALAEHLVRNFECKVVMLDRLFFPRPEEWDRWVSEQGKDDLISRNIGRLKEMAESITVLSVDAADPDKLKGIKERVEREVGAVQGVFHLDKPAQTGLILGKAASSSAALNKELMELTALEAAFPDTFLLLFSENLAESGGIGQVDQAARCAMITHFAQKRSASGSPTLALQLGTRAWSA